MGHPQIEQLLLRKPQCCGAKKGRLQIHKKWKNLTNSRTPLAIKENKEGNVLFQQPSIVSITIVHKYILK